ncbi:MAG: serine/threonine protein kinase, partial [Phycisphaerae bacterium]
MNEQQRYEQATAVFLEAYALSESLRAAFVSRRCAGDAELLGLVERLLEASRHKSVFASLAEQLSTMHAQIRREANELSLPSEERAGDTIDRFQLVKPLGEGGFGRVWLAEQRTPVRRLVALKVIKAGMDSKQIVARFDQERQALAVMDHAHIAKVFDAGTTLTGRPYFVMEFCEGSSIVAHCDTHKLAIPERLELFMQACRAVQHAHTKGVVHRDIKPSNVLVVKHDDQPQVKIIDFGIAKALEAPLTEQTFFTEHRQLIGTPEYMSPEQADGDLDIDTRTDVYSLGVLLYELLTGTTPFSGHDLRQAAFGELQRIIREVDPPKPSTRLQRSTVTISAIAENRRTEPRKLDSTVRGELDWIAMKALEKDRTRRYESASTLAADLQRYLNGEAIHAAPPSRTYLTRKFVRRHRGAVLAVSAVVLALTAGLFAFAWQARIAISERNRALAAEHESNQRAAELQNVSDFQAQMLAQVDAPSAGQRLMNYMQTKFATALEHTGLNAEQQTNEKETFARYLTRIDATDAAVEMIDSMILAPAVNAVDRQFADQPLVDAKLRDVLSDRYRDLGRIDQSMTLAQKAQSQFRAAAGAEDPRTLQAATKIGLL